MFYRFYLSIIWKKKDYYDNLPELESNYKITFIFRYDEINQVCCHR